MKKILVVTSSRADYFLLRPLLIKLKAIKEFQLEIIATGSHHLKSHGYTVKEIERDFSIMLAPRATDNIPALIS